MSDDTPNDEDAKATSLPATNDPPARRRWFRFSLRTMFIAVTVLAMALGWVTWQRQIVRERWAMRSWLRSHDAYILPDGETLHSWRPRRISHVRKLGFIRDAQRGHGKLPLIRRWFGDDYVEGICLTDDLANRRHEFERLFPEATIAIDPDPVGRYFELIEKIRLALAGPTDFECENVRLDDAVSSLKEIHEIEIQLHSSALEKAQIDMDMPISINAKQIPLGEALSEILAPFKPTFIITEEVLLITTEACAQEIRRKSPSSIILE